MLKTNLTINAVNGHLYFQNGQVMITFSSTRRAVVIDKDRISSLNSMRTHCIYDHQSILFVQYKTYQFMIKLNITSL